METWQIIFCLIVTLIIVVGLSILLTCLFVHNTYGYYDFAYIRSLVRKGEDIKEDLIKESRCEEKIIKYLHKHHYELKTIEFTYPIKIVGAGKIKFDDETFQYEIYTSRNCFRRVDKVDYDKLSKHIGEQITLHGKETKWTKKEGSNE